MNDRSIVFSVLAVVITTILAGTFLLYSNLVSMERNIESAIAKGIDPMAVRCAYASEKDMVCVAFGAANHQFPAELAKTSKK